MLSLKLSTRYYRHLKIRRGLPCVSNSYIQVPPYPHAVRFRTDDTSSSINNPLTDYLSKIGIQSEHQKYVLQSIRKSFGNKVELNVTNLSETFSEADLLALSNSIQQQQKKRQRKARKRARRQVTFSIPNETTKPTLTWSYGESLLDLAKSVPGQQLQGNLEEQCMEGPCGGQMNCSTCHVYLDSKTYSALPPPVEEELDMLDLAFEPKDTSRLGCQVKLDNALVGQLEEDHEIGVTLPSGVNNEWEE